MLMTEASTAWLELGVKNNNASTGAETSAVVLTRLGSSFGEDVRERAILQGRARRVPLLGDAILARARYVEDLPCEDT